MDKLLETINSPDDIKQLDPEQLTALAEEIRELITHSVSRTGGHLASNLGVVEMTLALHYVFDFKRDHLLWDVGHQCYAHKIITGRRELFGRLRMADGISGFPNPQESPYDRFVVGHAGTAIATALGMALGAQQRGTDERIVALVGDASIVNGTSFEALNNLGLVKRQMLIVLNDNSMAIDESKGAIAEFLAKVRLNHTYEDIRKTTHDILTHLPLIGPTMDNALEGFKRTLRMALTPSRLFESMNIPYFGPVDGHDVASLIELFRALEQFQTPAILHVYTKKGRGFMPADDDPTRFHSTGPFQINGSSTSFSPPGRSYTGAFADVMVNLAETDERVTAITAAMPDGTGLIKFREAFAPRCLDVGIGEEVAVDVAAGMAHQGLRPFVCIYSTFLQRSYDQIFQEVSLQRLPVVFCVDRAGLVGSDGPTHHGLMDLAFLRPLPHVAVTAPAGEAELSGALEFALAADVPVAVRYPRDVIPNLDVYADILETPFELGCGVMLEDRHADAVLVNFGALLPHVLEAARLLDEEGIPVSVFNARFAKPLDPALMEMLARGKTLFTVEDHYVACGFGSAVMEAWSCVQKDRTETAAPGGRVVCLGVPDVYVRHDKRSAQIRECGLDAEGIAQTVRRNVHELSKPHVEDIC